jgi:hypothetical protein
MASEGSSTWIVKIEEALVIVETGEVDDTVPIDILCTESTVVVRQGSLSLADLGGSRHKGAHFPTRKHHSSFAYHHVKPVSSKDNQRQSPHHLPYAELKFLFLIYIFFLNAGKCSLLS